MAGPNPGLTLWEINESDFPRTGSPGEKLRFLVGYSILAPSPTNTQPWKFAVSNVDIRLYVDRRRWLKVADKEQRALYLSAGCALENLQIAARHFGYRVTVEYCSRPINGPDPGNLELAADVFLDADAARVADDPALFRAIAERCTDRSAYAPGDFSEDVIAQMEACCTEAGIHLQFITAAETMRQMNELVRHADEIEFADSAFRRELAALIGLGVFGASRPASAFGRIVMTYLSRGEQALRQDHALIASAPKLGLLTSERDDRTSQVRAGQVLERLWLTATTLNVHLHPMSQMLQVPKVKEQFSRIINLPDLVLQQPFLLGRVQTAPRHTPRRPFSEFWVT